LPEVAEQEPNNDFSAPQPIPLGSTVSGVVQNEDVDYFVVEAKKGQRITAELEGIRLGYTFFDPYLAILNEERFELARSDDAALLRQDCLCSLIAPEDGKYIIQVRESAYGGDGSSFYRLHVGSFPRPTAVYPAGGRPGETITVRWIGDPAGDWTEEITLPSLPDPEFQLLAKDEHGIAPSPNVIRVVDLPNTLEVEPNDTIQQATPATAPGALERDHREARRRRFLQVHRHQAARSSTFACTPATRCGRRWIRCWPCCAATVRRLAAMTTAAGRTATCGSPRRKTASTSSASTTTWRRWPQLRLPRRDRAGRAFADDDAARADSVHSHDAGRSARQPHGADGQRDQEQLGRRFECRVREPAAGMTAEASR
jgi:hypothetical protein